MDDSVEAMQQLENIFELGVCTPAPLEQSCTLLVAWDRQRKSVRLCWSDLIRSCCWEEKVRPYAFEETAENRRHRVLRLAFHHLLIHHQLDRPNPWGILTSVRPTKIVHRFIDQGIETNEIRKILDTEYGMEPERIDLMMSTIRYQRPYLLSKAESRKRISIYLSFPFCPSRCRYCSFPGYDMHRWQKWVQPYLDAMLQEISALSKAVKELDLSVQTVYFGGGTPTAMLPVDMERILTAVQNSFNLEKNCEWTIEAGRPETLNEAMLEVLAQFPISRVCINPQTMQQITLDEIDRRHTVSLVNKAFELVHQNPALSKCAINSDLILGLPGENLNELSDTLEKLLELQPENITVHGLSIKRGSAFKEQHPLLCTGKTALALGDFARKKLAMAGYKPYYLYRQKEILALGENVGYTLPGKHCLYNIQMMEERQTILGIGVGASSKFISKEDWSLENNRNPKDLIQYIEKIQVLIQRKVDKLRQIV
jgi:oxygen-independent coproporphyrinogen-3 oxidase